MRPMESGWPASQGVLLAARLLARSGIAKPRRMRSHRLPACGVCAAAAFGSAPAGSAGEVGPVIGAGAAGASARLFLGSAEAANEAGREPGGIGDGINSRA